MLAPTAVSRHGAESPKIIVGLLSLCCTSVMTAQSPEPLLLSLTSDYSQTVVATYTEICTGQTPPGGGPAFLQCQALPGSSYGVSSASLFLKDQYDAKGNSYGIVTGGETSSPCPGGKNCILRMMPDTTVSLIAEFIPIKSCTTTVGPGIQAEQGILSTGAFGYNPVVEAVHAVTQHTVTQIDGAAQCNSDGTVSGVQPGSLLIERRTTTLIRIVTESESRSSEPGPPAWVPYCPPPRVWDHARRLCVLPNH